MRRADLTAPGRLRWLALRAAGAGLLAAAGGIHLSLYLTGYSSIPTIGWLFLLQLAIAFVLAAAVLATGSRLACAVGAGFALCTLGAYLVSVWVGLFGFTEVRTTAGIAAGAVEVAAAVVLATLAVAPAGWSAAAGRMPLRVSQAAGAVTGVFLVAVGFLAAAATVAAAGPGPVAAAGTHRVVLKTARIAGVSVVTDSRGLTLYWFALDSPATSRCTGSCAALWPPVTGTPTAGPGVTGRLGTITRPGGTTQATYDGHPLYTYVGDSAPGQAHGNGLNLNGGRWHEVTVRAVGAGRPPG